MPFDNEGGYKESNETSEIISQIEGLESGTIKEWLGKIAELPGGKKKIEEIGNMLEGLNLDFTMLHNMFSELVAINDSSTEEVNKSLVDMHAHLGMGDKEGMRIVMDELEKSCEKLEESYDSSELLEAA